MKRKIVHFPDPILKKIAKAVKTVTPEIRKLIKDMIETMHAAPGVGLAAPQVGVSLRVIVADVGEGPIALINPKITVKKGKQTIQEGCLSLPGIEAPVTRCAQVVVKGLDINGKACKYEAEGLLATVFQHEVDHLDGHVFIDRVSDPSTIKYTKLENEPKEELI